MAVAINKNLVSIDRMQFINSSLDPLVKNWSHNDNAFKYVSQEFSGDLLKLLKQRRVYPYENVNSFEKLNYLISGIFFSSLKDDISEKQYLDANNVWSTFTSNTMGDRHDFCLKRCFVTG